MKKFSVCIGIILALTMLVTSVGYAECYFDQPDPELVFFKTEVYSIGSTVFTRYRFKVNNWASYPEAMFESEPGRTTCVTRTWIDFYDGDGNRIYGFCSLGRPDNLNRIWIAFPECVPPPSSVYIVMRDRFCDATYVSNVVPVPNDTWCGINDIDGDGVADEVDNCPYTFNPDQTDSDLDGYGEACDCDDLNVDVNPDAEELCDYVDNECNGAIDDSDYDGDGVLVCDDLCPEENATGLDADSDGCVDSCSGLVNLVSTLTADGIIAPELENSLRSKAENVCNKVAKDMICPAVNMLGAFNNQINAQRGHKISDQGADMAISYASVLETQLLSQLLPEDVCE